MQDLSNVIAFMEPRFPTMETCFDGTNQTHRDHLEHGDSSNHFGGSEETLSDPNIHGGHRFQRQDSSFQPRPPLIKLEFPRFSNGDNPLA
ncbi:hypothetical protein ACFX1X_047413 [Malus domestica]